MRIIFLLCWYWYSNHPKMNYPMMSFQTKTCRMTPERWLYLLILQVLMLELNKYWANAAELILFSLQVVEKLFGQALPVECSYFWRAAKTGSATVKEWCSSLSEHCRELKPAADDFPVVVQFEL
jgi:hypothetical protein